MRVKDGTRMEYRRGTGQEWQGFKIFMIESQKTGHRWKIDEIHYTDGKESREERCCRESRDRTRIED
jgi:hypothetical protein